MRSVETEVLVLEPQIATHAKKMLVVLSDPAIYEHENPALQGLGRVSD